MKKKRTRIGATIKHHKTLKNEIGVSYFHIMDLPTAVLHDILFRLAINSIMNVKLVCKSLYTTLSHPDFVVNYSKNSPFATLLVPTKLCGYPLRYRNLNLVEVSDNNNNNECIVTTFKPKIPGWPVRHSGIRLAGTCNGLVCLLLRKAWTEFIYICNPIMGECVPLPQRKIKSREGIYAEYGFGFCTSSNHYKVLRIVSKRGYKPDKQECVIFTIGRDETWRDLAKPEIPSTNYFYNSVALNGAFHWFFMDNGGSTWISTFDLGEEKIGRLSHPHGLVLDSDSMKLMSINNQLCLIDRSNPFVIDVWKMKEYAVADSWTKDMILDISFIPELQCSRLVKPVTILQNGDMLFSPLWRDYLILYNPIKRKVIHIRVGGFGIIICAPSFLSVKEALMGGHQGSMNL